MVYRIPYIYALSKQILYERDKGQKKNGRVLDVIRKEREREREREKEENCSMQV